MYLTCYSPINPASFIKVTTVLLTNVCPSKGCQCFLCTCVLYKYNFVIVYPIFLTCLGALSILEHLPVMLTSFTPE